MESTFEEVSPVLPRDAFFALIGILVATDIFILICTQLNIGTTMWTFIISTLIFSFIILFVYVVKLKVRIENDIIYAKLIKSYEIPFTDVIDIKSGDIDIIRNYSGWGIKHVKFKNLICAGYDEGISLKLMGKRVFTISTSYPEDMISAIKINKE